MVMIFIFIFVKMFLNVIDSSYSLCVFLQLDYKRGMNGDIRAMVDGKLVKKTEGGILVKIVVKIKKSESCEENQQLQI